MLFKYREEIKKIDLEIVKLFNERLNVVSNIKEYKKENNLPILDKKREEELLAILLNEVDEDKKPLLEKLYNLMFSISKEYQK